jgi:acyl-CoA reductase-like NAD-dependent aldehyde dehydrogenase
MCSRYLSLGQLQGLKKLLNVLVPHEKNQENWISPDRFLASLPQGDRDGLLWLLSILRFLPHFFIRWWFEVLALFTKIPGFLGAPFRQIDLGLKGLGYSLFYNDEKSIILKKDFAFELSVWRPLTEKEIQTAQQFISPFFSQDLHPNLADTLNLSAQTHKPLAMAEKVFLLAKSNEKTIAKMSLKERIHLLKHLKRNILIQRFTIVEHLQRECKKSSSDAYIAEVFGTLDHLHYLISHGEKILQTEKVKTPITLLGKKSFIEYRPLGTVLVISPWNYPFYQAIIPLASAFLAGNSVIYKPSEVTPLKGLLEQLLLSSGFEPSWIQIVYGDGQTAQQLIAQKPQKIFFTGSVATGKKIAAQAAQDLTPVELELGGKDAMIVFPSVHLERAVLGAIWGGLTTSGQSCTSVERLLVHEDLYQEFKETLIHYLKNPKLSGIDYGSMTTQKQVTIVADQLKEAIAAGAIVLTGEAWDFHSPSIPPILIEIPHSHLKIWQEETFGPIMVMMPFRHESQLIEIANDSVYGLSASVWSNDLTQAKRVAKHLNVGAISINNVMLTEANPALPFGGIKQSGSGRIKGVIGLRNFTNIQSVMIDGNGPKSEVNWFPYSPEKEKLFDQMTLGFFTRGIKGWMTFILNGLKLESRYQKLPVKKKKFNPFDQRHL